MIKKFLYPLCMLSIVLTLTGCSYVSSLSQEPLEDTWSNSGFLTIGNVLTVQNADSPLSLLDSKDALSADGLYYAAWTIGDSQPYDNSDGDTVDLYDAQLYLLLGEYPSGEDAQSNMQQWLALGKSNYELLTEEDMTCSGQSYTLITYNCVNADNPYDRGVSAFGVRGSHAVCIELTCMEQFEDDLRDIMINFLNNCSYDTE